MKKSILYIFLFLNFINVGFAQNERPQEPQPPFDYIIENVTFMNISDGIKLAGTLTIPKNTTEFPTVVLISGSGPQDRNSELLGHKPFWVIADHLTKNGIGVLRVDDRGTAESEGNYNEASLDAFIKDTESALAYLQSRKDINSSKIGLIGHSLGGLIAPIVATKSQKISFVIMLAGPGIRGDKLMLLQKAMVERQMGVPETAIKSGQINIGGAYDLILETKVNNRDSIKAKLKPYFKKAFGGMLPENQVNAISSQLSYPWLVDFIKYDPSQSLSQITCPVLALNGSKDLQVPADENLKAIDSILNANGNQNVTTKKIENHNHLFQKCETGLPQEYEKINQTFSPLVLEMMTEWIKNIEF
jgi:fermentation-respiration switch protein FrsA (DUF1100 family)